ncbi:Snf7-domain-containing protein [Protomyces lactucae-debilis]|uniref:Snf7-domain-containing protein n=1 Tax=Protomyces lactucae-debilis TaxID=2754530 RepID=A0A1Y2FBN4_PROLT|nr:Snf7-domain-containing protein [Protomyces lactucae-debilis]ORY81332.1 Snf7-domain-containing protein [Protomyces lactucae-debilis]
MTLLNTVLSQPSFKKSRLPSLYSDFATLKVSNKDGYDANIDAWIQALNKSLLEETFLSIKEEAESSTSTNAFASCLCITTSKALSDILTSSQWGKPLALASVEHEAVAKRAWIPKDLFMAQEESIYAPPSRLTNVTLGAAFRWGVSKFWTPSTPTKLSGAAFVVVANIELVADKLMKQYQADMQSSYSGHITTRSLFARWCTDLSPYRLSGADIEVLLKYLARDQGTVVQSEGETLKFLPAGVPLDDVSISQTDEAVAQLKATLALLDDQIKSLSQRCTDLEIEAKEAISKSQKTLALSKLRTRKQLETTTRQRADQRAQVEAVLVKIDEAATNMGLLNAMEQGSFALDRLLKSMGGMERVDAIMDQVSDSMAQVDEVQQAMTIGQDDTEVEDAYEQMLAEASASMKQVTIDEPMDLPSVPTAPVKQPETQELRQLEHA